MKFVAISEANFNALSLQQQNDLCTLYIVYPNSIVLQAASRGNAQYITATPVQK